MNSALLILQWNTEFGNIHPSKMGVLSSGKPQELKRDKAVLHRSGVMNQRAPFQKLMGLAQCPCGAGRWDRGQSSTRATKRVTRAWFEPSVLLQLEEKVSKTFRKLFMFRR